MLKGPLLKCHLHIYPQAPAGDRPDPVTPAVPREVRSPCHLLPIKALDLHYLLDTRNSTVFGGLPKPSADWQCHKTPALHLPCRCCTKGKASPPLLHRRGGHIYMRWHRMKRDHFSSLLFQEHRLHLKFVVMLQDDPLLTSVEIQPEEWKDSGEWWWLHSKKLMSPNCVIF